MATQRAKVKAMTEGLLKEALEAFEQAKAQVRAWWNTPSIS
jgi:hypothetical protein